MNNDLQKDKYQIQKKSHVSSPFFNVLFFFQGEKTNKKTLQRLLALKYVTQDMDCPFHPKIVHCFLIASSSEHWEPREIRCKCLMSQILETQEDCWWEEGIP